MNYISHYSSNTSTGLLLCLLSTLLASCSPESEPGSASDQSLPESDLPAIAQHAQYRSHAIGDKIEGMPWITDLAIADLDQDGLLDILACEGRQNKVVWIRQAPSGTYSEIQVGQRINGPAHVEASDFDLDGDLDLLISGMGIITPNNQRIGSVVVMENDGAEQFANRVLLENVPRVTDTQAGDLDGDGDLDLAVGMFGYFEGEIRWLENLGDWTFASHPLLGISGTIHTPIVDLDGDGDLDIVALVTQDWEEVHAFINDGSGNFEERVLYGSANQDYGGSGLTISDLNEDGRPDIVFANGDGFDYSTPGSRPWHGVQWLENKGNNVFEFQRIGDFSGSYSPVALDMDSDGDLDVVVASGFNDWSNPNAHSLAYFENDGEENFIERAIAKTPTHLVVVDAADLDGDGNPELVTGGLHFYPPYDKLSRITLWEKQSP